VCGGDCWTCQLRGSQSLCLGGAGGSKAGRWGSRGKKSGAGAFHKPCTSTDMKQRACASTQSTPTTTSTLESTHTARIAHPPIAEQGGPLCSPVVGGCCAHSGSPSVPGTHPPPVFGTLHMPPHPCADELCGAAPWALAPAAAPARGGTWPPTWGAEMEEGGGSSSAGVRSASPRACALACVWGACSCSGGAIKCTGTGGWAPKACRWLTSRVVRAGGVKRGVWAALRPAAAAPAAASAGAGFPSVWQQSPCGCCCCCCCEAFCTLARASSWLRSVNECRTCGRDESRSECWSECRK